MCKALGMLEFSPQISSDAFTAMRPITLNCLRSQTKSREETLTLDLSQLGKFWKTFAISIL